MIFKDQMNRTIRLEAIPKRIVSLVPSQTEFLFDLGLENEVVGITKFCIHPEEWFRSKTRIGGTKTVNIEKVKALNPDLIIANKEENTQADIEALEKIAPVWISDISTLSDAFEMMQQVGEICGKSQKADEIVQSIKSQFETFENPFKAGHSIPKVIYLIWKNPYLIAGKNTFIDDMLQRCGLENLTQTDRYPEWKPQESETPDFILLSSEPFPFKQIDLDELQNQFPQAKILLVDGELFSWYGSRLKLSVTYFKTLFK
jgi:ABC-type Fe3+-hydroxamate transport system substrate-binding protein